MTNSRQLHGRRLARAAVHLAVGAALALASGAGLQAAVEHIQRGRFQPPGQLVDIGHGRLIHLRTWGSEGPGPTIMLSISANTPSSAWAWVAEDLAREYRVLAFDRPGMGWSAGGSGPRDALSAARALDEALAEAGVRPPFVVVGHSYGGFAARAFAGLRQDDLAGLVLLDTTQPVGTGSGFATYYRWRAWLARTGLYVAARPANPFVTLPGSEAEAAHAVSLWTSHLDASADELDAWVASVEQVRAVDLSNIPLLVVSGYGSAEQVAVQREIASASRLSTFVELPVGHVTMLTDRDEAELVSGEIRRFMASLADASIAP